MDLFEVIDTAEAIRIEFMVLELLILMIAAAIDIKEKKIPLCIPFSQMILSLIYWIYLWVNGKAQAYELVMSFVPGLLLLVICLITRKGIGPGDGLMVLLAGPILGMMDMTLAVFISFTLSAVFGGLLLVMKRGNVKSKFAFMPFMAAGVGVMCIGSV